MEVYVKVGRGTKAHIFDGGYGVLCGAESNGRGIKVRSGLTKIENSSEHKICRSCVFLYTAKKNNIKGA